MAYASIFAPQPATGLICLLIYISIKITEGGNK